MRTKYLQRFKYLTFCKTFEKNQQIGFIQNSLSQKLSKIQTLFFSDINNNELVQIKPKFDICSFLG